MHPRTSRYFFALALALTLAAHPLVASAAIGDVAGDRILGQPSVTTGEPNGAGLDASGLYRPEGVAFDAAGNLFVVDQRNNRVLGYRSPMTTDRAADLVIGQPDFNSDADNNGGVSARSLAEPSHLAVTPAGDLYVADSENNRVLQYERPFATDTVADRVLGQPDFESNDANNGGVGAESLY
jgi:hypothetical protein